MALNRHRLHRNRNRNDYQLLLRGYSEVLRPNIAGYFQSKTARDGWREKVLIINGSSHKRQVIQVDQELEQSRI